MKEILQLLGQSLAGQTGQAWLSSMEDIADEAGYFQPLSAKHNVAFVDAGKTLLVSFESLQAIQTLNEDAQPVGFKMARDHEWSLLSFFCDGQTWFRDPAVYRYLDQLVDDGFFEDFDTVIFYGAGSCGYAACAFSVAAPGARVLALSPQATLDPRVCEWDERFRTKRRLNFTDRYGFAPDMIDAAERATIIYDPREDMDAMHAALFARTNVDRLRMPLYGPAIEHQLTRLDLLTPLLIALAKAPDIRGIFHQLHRARRQDHTYLRALLLVAEDSKRWPLAKAICEHTAQTFDAPRFKKRAEKIEALMIKSTQASRIKEKAG